VSETTAKSPPERRLSAEELMHSIRQGLESRDWRFAPVPPDFPPHIYDALVHMTPYADLDKLGPRARPGRSRRPILFARRVLGQLLNPWTEMQGNFNRLVVHILTGQTRELYVKSERDNQALRLRLDEMRLMWFEMRRRVEELESARAAGVASAPAPPLHG
jgi:hypothetical protein